MGQNECRVNLLGLVLPHVFIFSRYGRKTVISVAFLTCLFSGEKGVVSAGRGLWPAVFAPLTLDKTGKCFSTYIIVIR